jgi:hypothetical protein
MALQSMTRDVISKTTATLISSAIIAVAGLVWAALSKPARTAGKSAFIWLWHAATTPIAFSLRPWVVVLMVAGVGGGLIAIARVWQRRGMTGSSYG